MKGRKMERAKPKKVLILYFSGTGNTWWISEMLKRNLEQNCIQVLAESIEKFGKNNSTEYGCVNFSELINGYDCIGFGYPVYGSDVPQIMKDFMIDVSKDIKKSDKKPMITDKPAFIFCSQWMWSGDGARTGTEFLGGSFNIMWAEHFNMPNNVCVNFLKLPFTNDRVKINKILEKTERKINRFASKIIKGKESRRGFNFFSFLSGQIQRVPFRLTFDRFRNDISIDTDKCTLCMKCVRMCPSGNLVAEGRSIKIKGCCIICLRCYDFCPVSAVKYMKQAHKQSRGIPYKGPVEGFDPEHLLN
jgi:ferredoxin